MLRSVRGCAGAVLRRLGPVARLVAERDDWRRRAGAAERELKRVERRLHQLESRGGRANVREVVPPGHFYSPIPDLDEVRAREEQIFDRGRTALPGIDLREADQLALLAGFEDLYQEQPFSDEPADGLRYGFSNGYFAHGDGLALYSMLRTLRPPRLIEIGSGWSSALALDVNDRFLEGEMHCTFVEPYPDRLNSLLRPADRSRVRVIEEPLHRAPGPLFGELAAGDLLFIDSTHVSRVGSDVNQLLLDIIPTLPPGVHVHLHDVFWPFEYPKAWVFEGKAWNEDYLLRALLVSNERLRITWFNDYLHSRHHDAVAAAMPLWARNPGGSIYLVTC